jgi:DNA polymerase-3 subunit chi
MNGTGQMKSCVFHDVGPGRQDRQLFEIVEHAYSRREKVLIFAQSEERAVALDRMLWILRQESFIPHRIFSGNKPDTAVPVAIVTAEINPIGARILIADGHCSLDFACDFDSVHEFVQRSSPEVQESCRNRFRAYRARQIPVEHLKE